MKTLLALTCFVVAAAPAYAAKPSMTKLHRECISQWHDRGSGIASERAKFIKECIAAKGAPEDTDTNLSHAARIRAAEGTMTAPEHI